MLSFRWAWLSERCRSETFKSYHSDNHVYLLPSDIASYDTSSCAYNRCIGIAAPKNRHFASVDTVQIYFFIASFISNTVEKPVSQLLFVQVPSKLKRFFWASLVLEIQRNRWTAFSSTFSWTIYLLKPGLSAQKTFSAEVLKHKILLKLVMYRSELCNFDTKFKLRWYVHPTGSLHTLPRRIYVQETIICNPNILTFHIYSWMYETILGWCICRLRVPVHFLPYICHSAWKRNRF